MIYLTKTDQAAIKFVNDYVSGCWLDQGDGTSKYQNLSYASVKNPVSQFRGFFVDEQHKTCCYCSREIINDHTTELEHIIPRTEERPEVFERYYQHSDLLRDNVISQSVFLQATEKQQTPPQPHHVAYHNIVASCNGRTFHTSEDFTCCNRARGDHFLPPFNLMENSIGYLPDGTILYLKDLTDRTPFELLNLNKQSLVNIRRLWYLFSRSALSISDIVNFNVADLQNKINEHALVYSPTITVDLKLAETFSIPGMWAVFVKYAYFGSYYRNN
ncbi:hypothetical protein [Mucilaginibacter defluvii]|uniref:HNH endonuclease n=1 Tax=Mucilaginibacter defluvii TaxID=1196019 RepID=A0ABP9FNE5_9SPHI